jgi:hypothetical protein
MDEQTRSHTQPNEQTDRIIRRPLFGDEFGCRYEKSGRQSTASLMWTVDDGSTVLRVVCIEEGNGLGRSGQQRPEVAETATVMNKRQFARFTAEQRRQE